MKMKPVSQRLIRGLTAVFVGLLIVFVGAWHIVCAYRSTIDMYMNTKSYNLVTETVEEGEDLYSFKPKDECSTTEKLVKYHMDLNERIEEEGCVLLENKNNALPLKASENKLTLIGNTAYRPWKGGLLGSRTASGQDGIGNNEMPNCEVVDLVAALEEENFVINPAMGAKYAAKRPNGAAFMELMDLFTLGGVYTASTHEVSAYNKYGLFSETSVSGFEDDAELNAKKTEYSTAIVSIGRPGSEAMSYIPGNEGKSAADYAGNENDVLGLSNQELSMLAYAKANYAKVVVLLNTAVAMDLPELTDYADAVLWIGNPNDYGFRGVVDVLKGDVSPSGHLTDTYAARASVSPAMQNFGIQIFSDVDTTKEDFMKDVNFSYQAEMESIYIGYKYYESRYYDCVFDRNNAKNATEKQTADGGNSWNYDDEVVYSFGEGYSYTTFKETLKSWNFNPRVKDGQLFGELTATVEVENTGSVPGKHAVQLYMQAPYTKGGMEKSAIQLAGYGKTKLLSSGGKDEVTITVDAAYLSSYDMEKEHYVLESGKYYFATGNGAHDALNNIIHNQDSAKAAGSYGVVFSKEISTLNITRSKSGEYYKNQLNMGIEDYGVKGYEYLSRSDWNGTFPKTVEMARTQAMFDGGLDNNPYTIKTGEDTSFVRWGEKTNYKYTDLKLKDGETLEYDNAGITYLVDQITIDEAIFTFMNSRAFIQKIDSINQPMVYEDDGPTGFSVYKLGTNSRDGRYKVAKNDPYYGFTLSTLPTDTVIGCTWSHELAEEAGEMVGNDSIWSGTTILWGPGSNIHRTPYNARNVEYFSEDGVLSGEMVKDYARGAKKYGAVVMDKHFAFNDLEINRSGVAPFMSEQSARENELRAYQIGVESGDLLGLMTAYNRVGACYSSAHLGLMQGILRGEWGFKGIVISDLCGYTDYMTALGALSAGTDLMLQEGATVDSPQWKCITADSIKGDATLQLRLKEAMRHIEYVVLNSNLMNGVNSSSKLVRTFTWYDNLLITAMTVFSALTVAGVVGTVFTYIKKDDKEEQK